MDLNLAQQLINKFPHSLEGIKKLVYDPCDFKIADFKLNNESVEYDACSFRLHGKNILYRMSKITPSKVGQFVTVWKRDKNGKTDSFEQSDQIDFMVVTARKEEQLGQFIFPAAVMMEKGIFSQNGKQGKRGIRVYPPWDKTENAQARKTQAWQIKYFLTIDDDNPNLIGHAKKLYQHL